jgi:hypothetical protein
MGHPSANGVYILIATKDSNIQYWAAATRRKEAVATVRRLLGIGWKVTLTNWRLSPKKVSELELRPDDVRQLQNGSLA